jgi:ABC-type nitrate/sulfonate/bicarbonate transport system permease component
MPSPGEVLLSLLDMIRTGEMLSDVAISLSRIIVGIVLGSASAILVGLLTGSIPYLSYTIGQVIQPDFDSC